MVDTVDSKSTAKSVEVQILSRAMSCCTIFTGITETHSVKNLLLFLAIFHNLVCLQQVT